MIADALRVMRIAGFEITVDDAFRALRNDDFEIFTERSEFMGVDALRIFRIDGWEICTVEADSNFFDLSFLGGNDGFEIIVDRSEFIAFNALRVKRDVEIFSKELIGVDANRVFRCSGFGISVENADSNFFETFRVLRTDDFEICTEWSRFDVFTVNAGISIEIAKFMAVRSFRAL